MSRILIVEDEDVLASTLREVLEDAGHEVTVAGNGKQALELLQNQRPDLVLLDLMLPVLDGNRVLEVREQTEALRSIPVIVMSSVRPSLVSQFGFVRFLQKPFLLKSLQQALQDGLADATSTRKE